MHKNAVHSQIRNFNCTYCEKKFSSSTNLKSHIIVVHEKVRKFKCGTCGQAFFLKGNLKQHDDKVHKGIRIPCSMCDITCIDTGHLNRHFRAAHEHEKYACNLCNKMFSAINSQSDLKRHSEKDHDGEMSFTQVSILTQKQQKSPACDTCGKTFRDNSVLKEHEQVVHQDIRFECDSCHKTFTHTSNLKRHKKNIHEKAKGLFPCSFCEKSMSTASNLKRHIGIEHKALKIPCEFCNKIFHSKEALLCHTEKEHQTNSNEQSLNGNYKKPFPRAQISNNSSAGKSNVEIVCSECKKMFLSKEAFENHYNNLHDNSKLN